MKTNEIKGARARLGLSQHDMAELLEISSSAYSGKETGKFKFTDREKIKLGEVFNWNIQQINENLYDGILPLGRIS